MLEKLQAIEDKYQELEAMISDPNVMADMQRWQQHTRAHARLTPLITAFRTYKETLQAVTEAREILAEESDAEMRELAKAEMEEHQSKLPEMEQELRRMQQEWENGEAEKRQTVTEKEVADVVSMMTGIRSWIFCIS